MCCGVVNLLNQRGNHQSPGVELKNHIGVFFPFYLNFQAMAMLTPLNTDPDPLHFNMKWRVSS